MNNIEVYIALGSNMGDRDENIKKAILLMLKEFGITQFRIARTIETEAWGFKSDTNFYNTVICLIFPKAGQDPTLHSLYILHRIKNIEKQLGRVEEIKYDENGNRIYHSRPIDLDILFYGDEYIDTKELIVPHPHIKERDFVMIPLKEVVSETHKLKFIDYFRS